MAREILKRGNYPRDLSTISPTVPGPFVDMPQSDIIFSARSKYLASQITPIIRSHRKGTMLPKDRVRVGESMREANRKRIEREARKAFGETKEEQAGNFRKQFVKSGESYDYMAQDLKNKKIRLGRIALKRLAQRYESADSK